MNKEIRLDLAFHIVANFARLRGAVNKILTAVKCQFFDVYHFVGFINCQASNIIEFHIVSN